MDSRNRQTWAHRCADRAIRGLAYAVAASVLGCSGNGGGGSLAAKSAPYVGCKGYEITTSDGVRLGDVLTWTATCQGREYRCSHTRHDTTECTDTSSGGGAASLLPPEDDTPKIAATVPPTGAGGFDFGSEIGAASRLCTAAGKAWKELSADRYECSAPPADVGFAAIAGVEACEGKVCGVRIIAEAGAPGASQLVARYTQARAAFAQKYGGVYASASKGMDGPCLGDELGACFEAGRASASTTWTWPSGQTLQLSVGKGSGRGEPVALRMIYRTRVPVGAGQPRLDNL